MQMQIGTGEIYQLRELGEDILDCRSVAEKTIGQSVALAVIHQFPLEQVRHPQAPIALL